MMPKEFIQKVLIDEIGEIHEKYPYIAFASMTIGIEFLGKCLNEHDNWNYYNFGQPRLDFENSIKAFESFKNYVPLLVSHNLWDSLRNGFSHSFVPKDTISLSRKADGEYSHLHNINDHKINLRCEEFYIDFKNACEYVIKMESFNSEKMNRPLLYVPNN